MLIKGPSDRGLVLDHRRRPRSSIMPAGRASRRSLDLGVIGGDITTTGGGIITYRVGTCAEDLAERARRRRLQPEPRLRCRRIEPDRQDHRPRPRRADVHPRGHRADHLRDGVVTKDLLNDVITPGKTPLLPESLEIVEPPSAGTATITNGVFSFTAPAAGRHLLDHRRGLRCAQAGGGHPWRRARCRRSRSATTGSTGPVGPADIGGT